MNALMVADTEADRPEELRQGPGGRLRSLREAQKLSVADVSRALHLSPAMLERLESDDYAALPNSVFVQGYLRNYARFLNQPVEPYIQAFNERRPDPQQEHQDLRASRVPIKIEVRSNHVAVRLATWGISLALLALLALWGKGYLNESGILEGLIPASSSGGDGGSEPLVIPPLPITPAAPGMAAPEPLRIPPPMEEKMPEEPAVEAAPPAAPETPPTKAPTAGKGKSEAAEPAKSSQLPAAKAEPESKNALAKEEAPEEKPATPQESGYSVVLEMVGKSWVDVRDADGKLVVVGELNAGEKRALSGKPPFNFVFGKASRVRMTVNGKPFNIEQYSRRDVARFSFDPSAG